MTKTIEQLTARVRELEADLAAARQIIDEENKDHIEQLAASQLSNQQLRESLHYSLGAWHYDGVSDEHGSIFKEANDRCDTQPSTEALDAYVAEKTATYKSISNGAVVGYRSAQIEIATLTKQRDLAVCTLDKALRALIHASGHVDNEDFVKVMMARDAIKEAISAIKESEGK